MNSTNIKQYTADNNKNSKTARIRISIPYRSREHRGLVDVDGRTVLSANEINYIESQLPAQRYGSIRAIVEREQHEPGPIPINVICALKCMAVVELNAHQILDIDEIDDRSYEAYVLGATKVLITRHRPTADSWCHLAGFVALYPEGIVKFLDETGVVIELFAF